MEWPIFSKYDYKMVLIFTARTLNEIPVWLFAVYLGSEKCRNARVHHNHKDDWRYILQILFKVFISPLPLVLKDQLSMQLLCDLRSELAVGLFCWNIWKHILKSTVAFLNLSNCQGQADICENWNWHFLSKFIDDIKTKTVFLLFLYNILPYIMASSFQHLKALSLWRWWWTLNKFGSLQTSHRCCEKRQRRRAETFALLSFLILLCQDIYTIFRGNNQMSNISMKLSLKHGMINERSKHGNEAQIIYCGIFCEKSYFIITLIQQNIHSFMVIWPRSEN